VGHLDMLGLVTYAITLFLLTSAAIRWLRTFPFTQGEGVVPTLVNFALLAAALALFYPAALIEPWHKECPLCPALVDFKRGILRNAVFCGALSVNYAVLVSFAKQHATNWRELEEKQMLAKMAERQCQTGATGPIISAAAQPAPALQAVSEIPKPGRELRGNEDVIQDWPDDAYSCIQCGSKESLAYIMGPYRGDPPEYAVCTTCDVKAIHEHILVPSWARAERAAEAANVIRLVKADEAPPKKAVTTDFMDHLHEKFWKQAELRRAKAEEHPADDVRNLDAAAVLGRLAATCVYVSPEWAKAYEALFDDEYCQHAIDEERNMISSIHIAHKNAEDFIKELVARVT
jgi:hypothetical protein